MNPGNGELPMDLSNFQGLPDDAQLWVFGFDQPLSDRDKENIEKHLDTFLPGWMSHQAPVQGGYTILYDRFVLVAGYCPEGLSGCSMDSCVSSFKGLKARCGLDALNRNLVFYRDREGQVQSLDRSSFQRKVDSAEITPASTVFDTTLQKLGQLRSGGLETTFEKSWHARAFLGTGYSVPRSL
jgi:hypothetical protein